MKKINWNEILTKEGFDDWTVVEDSSGGLCMASAKTLYVLPHDDALFLHELAHVKTMQYNEQMGDKTGHHSIWGDCFTELVRKYLVSP